MVWKKILVYGFVRFLIIHVKVSLSGHNIWKKHVVENFNYICSCLGSFDIVHVKDNTGHQFATRISNIFIIGKTNKSHVSLPKGKGVRLTIAEERDRRLQEKAKMSSM